jgi:putative DNA primase/helicase
MVRPGPPEIARRLAERIDRLAPDLLPAGHRDGREWRCGSVAGEAGASLGVRLTGAKAGVWNDFSTGQRGDALDLLRAVLGLDMGNALAWSRRWLGIDAGEAAIPRRSALPKPASPEPDPERWRRPWHEARPIADTLAEAYLAGRRLRFDDCAGRVLRYAHRRYRRHPDSDSLERQPALLAALSDIRTGEQCGIINVYLRLDGHDRLRDRKGKTVTGRAQGAAIMLSAVEEPSYGLSICEGMETGLALLMAGLAPVWCCGGAGNLASFPVLPAIEALTVAADADEPGQHAASAVAARWRQAGREAIIIAPPAGDWADPQRSAS